LLIKNQPILKRVKFQVVPAVFFSFSLYFNLYWIILQTCTQCFENHIISSEKIFERIEKGLLHPDGYLHIILTGFCGKARGVAFPYHLCGTSFCFQDLIWATSREQSVFRVLILLGENSKLPNSWPVGTKPLNSLRRNTGSTNHVAGIFWRPRQQHIYTSFLSKTTGTLWKLETKQVDSVALQRTSYFRFYQEKLHVLL